MKALTKKEFIEQSIKDNIAHVNAYKESDKDFWSNFFFTYVTNVCKTFEIFGIEKPDYLKNESWTIHEDLADALMSYKEGLGE